MHPSDDGVERYNRQSQELRKIARVLIESAMRWRPEPRSAKAPQSRRRGIRRRSNVIQDHVWTWADGLWRCEVCLKRTSSVGKPRPQNCSGAHELLGEAVQAWREGSGHVLAAARDRTISLLMCLRCGAWGAERPKLLLKQCPGKPTRGGRDCLARVAKGRHPHAAFSERMKGWVPLDGRASD